MRGPAAPLLAAALCALPGAAQPQAAPIRDASVPISLTLGIASVRLPEGERMGLVGAALLFDVGAGWAFGPAVYGAATGRRGGLFVGGIELQRRWSLSRTLSLATGVFAGGGGGAAAPVGSGLMLRPALTLLRDIGPSWPGWQAGLSWSRVSFPSGDIGSTQLGLVLSRRGEFRHLVGGRPGDAVAASHPGGLGFDRMVATAGRYRLTDGSGRRIGLAGARAERRSATPGVRWGMEAAAAVSGDAAGYMEILATAAVSTAWLPEHLPSWRIGLRAAGGLGGGGAMPTGGGLLGKATATTEWQPWPGWTLGAEAGIVRGAGSALRARHAQLWLGVDLEPGMSHSAAGRLVHTEWGVALQHHARALREDGSRRPLSTIGLRLSRYVGDTFYLTGQAHSAFSGGAGAYSIGLVGAGFAVPVAERRRLGAELLVGAAGGAGVATAGGAIVQALVWAGWTPADAGEWRIGLGTVRAMSGGLASPVLELSWTRSFGAAGR